MFSDLSRPVVVSKIMDDSKQEASFIVRRKIDVEGINWGGY